MLELDVAPIDVAQPCKAFEQRFEGRDRLLWTTRMPEITNCGNFSALLCARCERPCRRAAEQRDEFAPLHSITSSARPVSGSGTVSPSVLAVLRLRDSAYLTARWIGKSPGLSPLRMRST